MSVTQLPPTPQKFTLDAIVYQQDLCKWLKKSDITLWRWVKSGYLPKPQKLGQDNCWPAEQIAAWARERGLLLTSGTRHTI